MKMNASCNKCTLKHECNNRKTSRDGKRLGGAIDLEKCFNARDYAYGKLTDVEREDLIEEGYRDLACAIIKRALDDIVKPETAMNKNVQITDNPLEFLKSKWASTLSGVSNDKLMEVLERYECKVKGNDSQRTTVTYTRIDILS